MKFNFKDEDVKSWTNRHDVKIGDVGYFADSFVALDDKVSMDRKETILNIWDKQACCFNTYNGNEFCFFLPLDAVKEDKPKERKYRPIKNRRELTEVVCGKDWETAITAGDELLVRCKYNNHRINVLITQLEFDNSLELVSINNKSPKMLLENYEVKSVSGEWLPFGIEVKDDE